MFLLGYLLAFVVYSHVKAPIQNRDMKMIPIKLKYSDFYVYNINGAEIYEPVCEFYQFKSLHSDISTNGNVV